MDRFRRYELWTCSEMLDTFEPFMGPHLIRAFERNAPQLRCVDALERFSRVELELLADALDASRKFHQENPNG